MKKKLALALTGLMVTGSASSVFAAEGAITDVPKDHWASEAVNHLQQEGIVNGYGDGTFEGDKPITRYEVAEIVSKTIKDVMSKQTMTEADRKVLDNLADEFSNNLGVRVQKLEKKNEDAIKWNGFVRYDYMSQDSLGENPGSTNKVSLRLNPTGKINDHWTMSARLQGDYLPTADEAVQLKLQRVFATGRYGKFSTRLGRFGYFSNESEGLLFDNNMGGVELLYGDKWKGKIFIGDTSKLNDTVSGDLSASMQSIAAYYADGKWSGGLGYHHLSSNQLEKKKKDYGDSDSANIWSGSARYNFDKNVSFGGSYARNTEADNYDTATSVSVTYKGIDKSKPHSWGAEIAYRNIGGNVAFGPTYNIMGFNFGCGIKGVDFGIKYVPMKNVTWETRYLTGKSLEKDENVNIISSRVEFHF